MGEESAGKIKQLITSFDAFVSLYENKLFPKTAGVEEIKTAFKLGHFVEEIVRNFTTKNSLQNLMKVWECWSKSRQIKEYNQQFFEYACDHLLSNFFQYPDLSEKTLDIVTRMYTSLFPRERLQKVFSDLILYKSSVEAILEYAPPGKYQTYLAILQNSYETGNVNSVTTEIDSILSISKVEDSLHLLIGVLSLNNSESEIQKLILKPVLDKMLDRSALSKSFWTTLFKSIDKKILCECCRNCTEFLNSFLDFIVYLGCTMEKNSDNVWTPNEQTAFCPEISFSEILQIVKGLCETNAKVKDYVLNRLIEAKGNTECVIWDDIRSIVL